jgi:hypothetical protein
MILLRSTSGELFDGENPISKLTALEYLAKDLIDDVVDSRGQCCTNEAVQELLAWGEEIVLNGVGVAA